MRQVSIFCDEADEQDMSDGYYYITLVVHDQTDSIDQHVLDYQARLSLGDSPTSPSTWSTSSMATETTRGWISGRGKACSRVLAR